MTEEIIIGRRLFMKRVGKLAAAGAVAFAATNGATLVPDAEAFANYGKPYNETTAEEKDKIAVAEVVRQCGITEKDYRHALEVYKQSLQKQKQDEIDKEDKQLKANQKEANKIKNEGYPMAITAAAGAVAMNAVLEPMWRDTKNRWQKAEERAKQEKEKSGQTER